MKLFDKKSDRIFGIPLPFFMIGVLLLGCIAIIPTLLTPKTLSIRTVPEGAQIYAKPLFSFGDTRQLCAATPCDIELTRFTASVISVRLNGHYPRRIIVNPTEINWDRRFAEPVKLRVNQKSAERNTKIKACETAVENGDYDAAKGAEDGEPVLCYRAPPIMPRRARESGHCHAFFTISEIGHPQEIDIRGCTDDIFSMSSKNSVKHWRYYPARRGGVPAVYPNAEAVITYRLSTTAGTIIPEPRFDDDHPDHKGDSLRTQ